MGTWRFSFDANIYRRKKPYTVLWGHGESIFARCFFFNNNNCDILIILRWGRKFECFTEFVQSLQLGFCFCIRFNDSFAYGFCLIFLNGRIIIGYTYTPRNTYWNTLIHVWFFICQSCSIYSSIDSWTITNLLLLLNIFPSIEHTLL